MCDNLSQSVFQFVQIRQTNHFHTTAEKFQWKINII